MNKALRFVWLSLLTLICGVASAGTVVFDPTQESDVTTGGGTTIIKNGITLTITKDNKTYPTSFDAKTQEGKVCYALSAGCEFTMSSEKSAGKIKSITCEFFGPGTLYENVTSKYVYTGTKCVFGKDDLTSLRFGIYWGSIYLTKLTVECEGGENPDPGTGPGGGEEQTTTIAQLMKGG